MRYEVAVAIPNFYTAQQHQQHMEVPIKSETRPHVKSETSRPFSPVSEWNIPLVLSKDASHPTRGKAERERALAKAKEIAADCARRSLVDEKNYTQLWTAVIFFDRTYNVYVMDLHARVFKKLPGVKHCDIEEQFECKLFDEAIKLDMVDFLIKRGGPRLTSVTKSAL
jgi:hypothetical protein